MLKKLSLVIGMIALYNMQICAIAGPTAVFDSFEVCKDSQCNALDVLANDLFGCNKNVKVVATTQPQNGVSSPGCLVAWYAPNPGFVGADAFQYTVEDQFGLQDNAIVYINIVDQSPTAVDDNFIVCTDSNKIILDVLQNDLSSCDQNINIISNSQTGSSTVTILDNVLCYDPNPGFEGLDVFTYTIENSKGNQSTATVSILVTSTAGPKAIDDSFELCSTSQAADNVLFVLSNDFSGYNSDIMITGTTNGQHGTVSILAGGLALSYVPIDTLFEGFDSFTYTIEDGNGNISVGNVIIKLSKCQAGPTAVIDKFQICQDSNSNILDVLANDTAGCNLCGNGIIICEVTQPSNGSVSITAGGLNVLYTPTMSFTGIDSFTYTVKDGVGNKSTATVIITVVAPVAP